ncbi:competence-like protein [Halococcus morrhuae DSM 1307]|uniref:Competence-like protein n=1 Tax=Halococcus morrhuae DSM 1307 TaxID=931277 RepID=M0MCK5_HALMO|nr:competence-like protein [Halococcus morrhuae DSM 1307]
MKTVHADADGDDRETLNDEYLVFENTGSTPLDISGWVVTDEGSHEYMVPSGTTIGADETITLHTGTGDDAANDLYWDSGSPVWNNDGDTITVTDQQGNEVLNKAY